MLDYSLDTHLQYRNVVKGMSISAELGTRSVDRSALRRLCTLCSQWCRFVFERCDDDLWRLPISNAPKPYLFEQSHRFWSLTIPNSTRTHCSKLCSTVGSFTEE